MSQVFPTDETTLDLLMLALLPPDGSERSSLQDLLSLLSVGEWHQNDVIVALIDEVRRLRAEPG